MSNIKLLNGKAVSEIVKSNLKEKLQQMYASGLSTVSLAIIQVGNDVASSVYVKNKIKACEYIGIRFNLIHLPETTSQEELLSRIEALNDDATVTGILVQLPLPSSIDERKVMSAVREDKDVDGFHASNVGRLCLGESRIAPCTPLGIITLLKYYDIDISGKECVVVGRSNIVGKPMAMLLLQHDGTVTVCHSKTRNLKSICRRADILICAIGKPKFFNREYVKDGAVVIDAGIHRLEDGSLCGDVDFEDVSDLASAITPVPGGVGAMTVATLMENCVMLATNQAGCALDSQQ